MSNLFDPEAFMQRTELEIGQVVRIKGLKNKKSLNSKTGYVVGYNEEKDRFVVVIKNSGESKLIKPENLELNDPTWTRIMTTSLGDEHNCRIYTEKLSGTSAKKVDVMERNKPIFTSKDLKVILHQASDKQILRFAFPGAGHCFTMQVFKINSQKKKKKKKNKKAMILARLFSCWIDKTSAREFLMKERVKFYDDEKLDIMMQDFQIYHKIMIQMAASAKKQLGVDDVEEWYGQRTRFYQKGMLPYSPYSNGKYSFMFTNIFGTPVEFCYSIDEKFVNPCRAIALKYFADWDINTYLFPPVGYYGDFGPNLIFLEQPQGNIYDFMIGVNLEDERNMLPSAIQRREDIKKMGKETVYRFVDSLNLSLTT